MNWTYNPEKHLPALASDGACCCPLCTELKKGFNHTQRRILFWLTYEWEFEGSNSWRTFLALGLSTHRPWKKVRREVRKMAKRGVLKYGPMVDYDGNPCGGGYFFSKEWVMWRRARQRQRNKRRREYFERMDSHGSSGPREEAGG